MCVISDCCSLITHTKSGMIKGANLLSPKNVKLIFFVFLYITRNIIFAILRFYCPASTCRIAYHLSSVDLDTFNLFLQLIFHEYNFDVIKKIIVPKWIGGADPTPPWWYCMIDFKNIYIYEVPKTFANIVYDLKWNLKKIKSNLLN